MQFKTTKKLFRGQYQYKVVIACAGASWFRGGDWDTVLEHLKNVVIKPEPKGKIAIQYPSWRVGIKTQEDLDYGFKLHKVLSKLTDLEIRVESPWITVYTNAKSNVDAIVKIDNSKVKYVCIPPATQLTEGTIIMPKIDFDYRITLGKTNQNYVSFIDWAEQNKKLKLTKSCKRELAKNMSWGGSHFYVTGDNNLLMAKMHLGGSINKVERIIKA